MNLLRAIIAVLALASTIAGLLIPPPGVMAISGMAAILIFLLSFGSIAADALPLRVVPLVCSIVTMPLAVLVIVQPFSIALVSALIVVVQGVGWWGGRRCDDGVRPFRRIAVGSDAVASGADGDATKGSDPFVASN